MHTYTHTVTNQMITVPVLYYCWYC